MARPTFADIAANSNGWDAAFNQLKDGMVQKPYAMHLHTGDESDLESTFPAAAYEQCFVLVDHTVLGKTLYFSADVGGTPTWVPYSSVQKELVTSIVGAHTQTRADRRIHAGGTYPYQISLLPAAQWAGETILVKALSTGTLTVAANGAELIDGAASFPLTVQYSAFYFYSDGSTIHVS